MNLTSLAFLTILLPSASARVESHRKLNKVQQGEAIPGQYVIELDSGVGDSRGFTARVLQRSLRSNVIENYDFALKGFAVKDLPDEVLDFLLNLDDVLSVSEDGFVEMDQVQAGPTWGLDVIDGSDDDKYTYSFTGKGVDAYILDTGIAAHSDFEGRVASCISFANEACGSDGSGHGTHVAGTVGSKTYGVAKEVTLHDVKVLNAMGRGTYSGVIAAIDHISKIKRENTSKKMVINMSLSGGTNSALDNAINSAANLGIVVVVAAGNANADACNFSPSSAAGALAVGAMNGSNGRTVFSNWGSCVDIFAPGVGIVSLSTTGGTSTKAGTSMASPHVAGVAALYLEAGRSASNIQTDAVTGKLSNLSGSPNKLATTSQLSNSIPSTRRPTQAPTPAPTMRPTRKPTGHPTPLPTLLPSNAPAEDIVPKVPTIGAKPLIDPDSSLPTKTPASFPISTPLPPPTRAPTKAPTQVPLVLPTPSPVSSQCQASGQVCTAFQRCCSGMRCLRSWSPQLGRHRACRPRW